MTTEDPTDDRFAGLDAAFARLEAGSHSLMAELDETREQLRQSITERDRLIAVITGIQRPLAQEQAQEHWERGLEQGRIQGRTEMAVEIVAALRGNQEIQAEIRDVALELLNRF